jgi:O-antigen/teichoic acid export membrane protein
LRILGDRLNRREYLKHFAVLFTGTVAAQALNLASYPLLARIFSPADFGVFATFVASAAIPSALACGRFELAVPTAPRWGRFAILWLCFAVSAASGLISAVGAAVYWLVEEGGLSPVLPMLFGFCVFLTGFCAAGTLYLMRNNLYRMSSAGVVVRTGGAVAIQILLGLSWKSPLALIIGFAAGLASQALLVSWSIWTHAPPRPSGRRQMAALFRRYRRQVTVDIPSTFIAALSLNLLTLLLANLYGQRVVGYYALAQRIAIMPLQLFNDSLSQIFFQKAARAQEERGHFWSETRFNLLTSGSLSVAILVLILLFARPFTELYLGRTWRPAADMLVLLAPMLAMRSLAMSIGTTVFVLRRAHWLFVHNIANAGLLIVAYLVVRSLGLGVIPFVTLVVVLLTLEYAAFAVFLGIRARAGMTAAGRHGSIAAGGPLS